MTNVQARIDRLHQVENSFRSFADTADSPFIRMPRSSALLLADDLAEAITLFEALRSAAEYTLVAFAEGIEWTAEKREAYDNLDAYVSNAPVQA